MIYHIYGRDVASNLLEVDYPSDGIRVRGYIGKPVITRGNRNFETFFVNGRYVKSAMISKALEDACKDFMMQHKFPFAVLAFEIDTEQVDVNVHPTKMELRFQKQQEVYNTVFEGIHRRLLEPELIPQVEVPEPEKDSYPDSTPAESPFLLRPKKTVQEQEIQDEDYFIRKMQERVLEYHEKRKTSAETDAAEHLSDSSQEPIAASGQKSILDSGDDKVSDADPKETSVSGYEQKIGSGQKIKPGFIRETQDYHVSAKPQKPEEAVQAKQMNLFEEKLLKRDVRAEYKLVGQVFDTYWLVQFQDNLYIIDQHAAHERVLYERTLGEMKNIHLEV